MCKETEGEKIVASSLRLTTPIMGIGESGTTPFQHAPIISPVPLGWSDDEFRLKRV